MEDNPKEEEGFHIICGTSPKNGIKGVTPGIVGDGEGVVLDLTGLNNLLVTDLDYFIKHHEEILERAREKQYNRLKYNMLKAEVKNDTIC